MIDDGLNQAYTTDGPRFAARPVLYLANMSSEVENFFLDNYFHYFILTIS